MVKFCLYRKEGRARTEDDRKMTYGNLSSAINGADRRAGHGGDEGLGWVRGRVIGRNLIMLKKWGGLEEAGFSHWEVWTDHPSPQGGVLMKRGHQRVKRGSRQLDTGRGERGRGRWCWWLTLLCASHHYKSGRIRQYNIDLQVIVLVFLISLHCLSLFISN